MLLFEEPVQNCDAILLINIIEFSDGLFLPEAVVAGVENSIARNYIASASKKNLAAYGLELTVTRKKILNFIDGLSPDKLALKFNPNPRKPQTLIRLLENQTLKRVIEKFVHSEVDKLLVFVKENEFPVSLNLPKIGNADDFLIRFSDRSLEPLIRFQKTTGGIRYRLKFRIGNESWAISSKKVIALTNHPAWILVDNSLFKVENFGGKMILPFRDKPEIQIPNNSVKVYFEKFILKQASKLDIEAEGFGIEKNQLLNACELELTKDLFSKNLGISLQFVYSEERFQWNDPRQKETVLGFSPGHDSQEKFNIRQTIRNQGLENGFIEKLKSFGLSSDGSNLFCLSEEENDIFALPEWLRKNGEDLKKSGFVLKNIQIGKREIIKDEPVLLQKAEAGNDWFDINIEIKVGSFQIPFENLVDNILSGNRYYRLPGGLYFIIKEEWLSKFDFLVKFSKKEGPSRRISKSHFEVLRLLNSSSDSELESNKPDFQLPSILNAKLRPYQKEGVNWLLNHFEKNNGACLADDMGLGKTLQTIAVLAFAKAKKKKALNALLILPSSLVFNWESELIKFVPSLKFYRHLGTKRNKDYRLFSRNDITVTTYQTALNDVEILQKADFSFIVLDEAQYIKNSKSKVFKAINRFKAEHRISLSGTPIENSLSDLWSQMQFINPGHLGSLSFFQKEFIHAIEKKNDERRKKQLKTLIKPFVLRRKKEEVAKDLPDLEINIFYSKMTSEQRKFYESEKSKARNLLLDEHQRSEFQYQSLVLRTLLKLRQIVNHPRLVSEDYKGESGKFNDILGQLEQIRSGGHKSLMFSSFTKYLDLFDDEFSSRNQPFARLTGQTATDKRREAVNSFQNAEEVRAFLISTKAGGTGLNLTAAEYVFLLDPWWNPAVENQAIARAHRIGQTKKVIAVKFITKDSIEEKILALQEKKSGLAEDILSNNSKRVFTKKEIEYLLK